MVYLGQDVMCQIMAHFVSLMSVCLAVVALVSCHEKFDSVPQEYRVYRIRQMVVTKVESIFIFIF